MRTGRTIAAVLALWIGWSFPAAGQTITNGDFQDSPDLTGWTWTGDAAIVTGTGGNKFVVLSEPGAGGRSRIQQSFGLPSPPGWLSFRYKLSYGPPTRHSTVPPDGFTAFLTDAAGNRLILQPGQDPAFSLGYFYADTDGEMVYDSSYVQVTGPDGDDAYTVALNMGTLTPPQTVTLELGLAGGDNNVTTFAIVDDVQTDCPPGFCCDPATGAIEILDDGDPCTADYCSNGQAVHDDECNDTCAECNTKVADIVIMLDRTSSTSVDDMKESKKAAKGLLDFFGDSPIRPRVVIGTFNGPCFGGSNCPGNNGPEDRARLLGDKELTDSYGLDGSPGTGLYSVINNIPDDSQPPVGYTDVAAALLVARNKLEQSDPEIPEYIIVISDGIANVRSDGSLCLDICECEPARIDAEAEANAAESAGIKIAAVHYVGHGGGGCENDDVVAGQTFLRERIATSPDYFFEGSDMTPPDYQSQLYCTFYDVMQVIACDDDIDCTVDSCVDGACVYDDSGC